MMDHEHSVTQTVYVLPLMGKDFLFKNHHNIFLFFFINFSPDQKGFTSENNQTSGVVRYPFHL